MSISHSSKAFLNQFKTILNHDFSSILFQDLCKHLPGFSCMNSQRYSHKLFFHIIHDPEIASDTASIRASEVVVALLTVSTYGEFSSIIAGNILSIALLR